MRFYRPVDTGPLAKLEVFFPDLHSAEAQAIPKSHRQHEDSRLSSGRTNIRRFRSDTFVSVQD